jgi:hypothetical protein
MMMFDPGGQVVAADTCWTPPGPATTANARSNADARPMNRVMALLSLQQTDETGHASVSLMLSGGWRPAGWNKSFLRNISDLSTVSS